MIKNWSPILLFCLALLPVLWNGTSLVHFLVEHTHALCANEDDHSHPTAKECATICAFDAPSSEQPTATQHDYQELKIYLTLSEYLPTQIVISNRQPSFPKVNLWENLFCPDIFHPPIG
ncbi:MAG: hypothetical protein AB8G22_14935 [Saprospiraceae bacterium]